MPESLLGRLGPGVGDDGEDGESGGGRLRGGALAEDKLHSGIIMQEEPCNLRG